MNNEQIKHSDIFSLEIEQYNIKLRFNDKFSKDVGGILIVPDQIDKQKRLNKSFLDVNVGLIEFQYKNEYYLLINPAEPTESEQTICEHIANVYPSKYRNYENELLETIILNLRLIASKENYIKATLPEKLKKHISYEHLELLLANNEKYIDFYKHPSVNLISHDISELILELNSLKIDPNISPFS